MSTISVSLQCPSQLFLILTLMLVLSENPITRSGDTIVTWYFTVSGVVLHYVFVSDRTDETSFCQGGSKKTRFLWKS